MGFLDHLSNFFYANKSRRKYKRRLMQTVDIKVKIDCDGCERKVKKAASSLKGAKSVEVNRKQNRLTVTGYVDRNKVLRKIERTGKKAEFWPYVKYDLVSNPYAPGAYDKKAPSGFVRNVHNANLPNPNTDPFTSMFSDENPNSCSLM
ncbi:unnamed protein product [Cuscuta epithymum]|uniref:HMA domain-containing protein n=1 Tax=Cuscuta epithymum TaxID=186058 RepID=A0AAV0GES3_9ASTE|nr:unnamed protein product [Cuscuta epithymum]CAH9146390.1 unnamed protein product [Cuscuta epithymum]CAH9146391.1 unnamed protein product [Cuscuta epithymum]CAH9146392.1 unnamed protein product [Cuscuta epithymum]